MPAVLGAVLVGAGIALYVAEGPSVYGWFAYQPMEEPMSTSPVVLLSGHVWGLVMACAGAVLLSGVVGFLLGRRRHACDRA